METYGEMTLERILKERRVALQNETVKVYALVAEFDLHIGCRGVIVGSKESAYYKYECWFLSILRTLESP